MKELTLSAVRTIYPSECVINILQFSLCWDVGGGWCLSVETLGLPHSRTDMPTVRPVCAVAARPARAEFIHCWWCGWCGEHRLHYTTDITTPPSSSQQVISLNPSPQVQ